jgi:transcriptional regulator with XRE-family HTH domain
MNISMREHRGHMDRHTTDQAKTFGQVIRERRIELGLTQEQLAERIGEHVRQSDISRMERDYIMLPRRDRLEALAEALEVTPGYLLMHSGWITREERERLDAPLLPTPPPVEDATPISPAPLPDQGDLPDMHAPRFRAIGTGATDLSPLHEVLERARIEQERTGNLLRKTVATIESARRTRRAAVTEEG